MWRGLAWLLLAAMAGVWVASPRENAEAERPSLDEVEAAYLYNFGKFVRWPDGSGVLSICMGEQDFFEQTVTRLVTGETINGRRIEVHVLAKPADAGSCSMLFVGSAQQGRMDELLAATAGKPVLTVSDTQDFLAHGGMLQFVLMGDHVRFAVNLNATNRSRLSLSSELLKVAVSVIGQPEKGGRP